MIHQDDIVWAYVGPGPMTAELRARGENEGRKHLQARAAEGCEPPPEAGRGEKGAFLEPQRGRDPADALTSRM